MRRTYKYRAYCNEATAKHARIWLAICRKLYNRALEERITAYQGDKKSLSWYDQRTLTRPKVEHPELEDLNSTAIDEVLERLHKAYQAFFRRVKQGKEKPGFPRFANYDRYRSFVLQGSGWKLNEDRLEIRNVGVFKIRLHRPIEGVIKRVSVVRGASGKWYVCFSCDKVPEKPLAPTGLAVGLDMGLSAFIADSDGGMVLPPKFFRVSEARLRVKQRALARCKKGSNRRRGVKEQVAKLHEKIANQRKDWICKTALPYIEKYDLIAVENLSVRNMLKNKFLAKSISDAAWTQFISQLENKAEETHRQVVKVNARNTSQLCSGCGEIVKKTLAVRVHRCNHCGLVLDRDINAARNILGRAVPADAKPLDYQGLSANSQSASGAQLAPACER